MAAKKKREKGSRFTRLLAKKRRANLRKSAGNALGRSWVRWAVLYDTGKRLCYSLRATEQDARLSKVSCFDTIARVRVTVLPPYPR